MSTSKLSTLVENRELYLSHWFYSCPSVIKKCLPNWDSMTADQREFAYFNPSPEFIKADKKFREESERGNF